MALGLCLMVWICEWKFLFCILNNFMFVSCKKIMSAICCLADNKSCCCFVILLIDLIFNDHSFHDFLIIEIFNEFNILSLCELLLILIDIKGELLIELV